MSTSLDALQRSSTLASLTDCIFDLVIIGGGITGAGIARDAALRGMSVALIEQDDFAAGTSSRSSKLIHGGLRYLAMGDVALVRESALERKAVHTMAPHLAEPLWMTVPARNRLGLLKFMAGITAYERLGAVAWSDVHSNWDAEELAANEPLMDTELHPWACVYREYLTDDARLVLATLRAAAGAGAVVVSRMQAVDVIREGRRIDGVVARDRVGDAEVEIRARAVVNAAGPWAESVVQLESPDARSRLHLSKGVHIVLPRERLPLNNLIFLNTRDRRSIFAIPRGAVVYVGTTDTTYEGDRPLWPEIERSEVEYLLEPLARYFTGPAPTPDDVQAAWAGLRPLIAQPGKESKQMSRRDEIWIGDTGMVTIAGGKLTGFRKMAEDTLKVVERELARSLPPPAGLDPLPGGDFDGDLDALATVVAGRDGLSKASADRLVRLYGTEAGEVLALGAQPVVSEGTVMQGEVDWAVTEEGSMTLEDVLYRRTRAAWYVPGEREALVQPIADRMAALLHWTDAQKAQQIAAVRDQFADELTFRCG